LLDLNEIIKPVAVDLETAQKTFADLLKSPIRIINIIAKHMMRQQGKCLRPVLVLLSSRIFSEPTPETYKAAALVEMLHNATLIHDDVIDDSTVRRGRPTLNAIWKNKISVLMGDYILARSLTVAVGLKSLEAINILSESSTRMSQGEIAQLVISEKKHVTEEEYFQIIGDKTAALISACCQLGALTVSAPPEKVEVFKNFGEKLGLAFQIKDDLLDIYGEEKVFGKTRGIDLKNGKVTLPLIHALKQVENKQQNKIMKKVKKRVPRKELHSIIQFIREQGGIQYAMNKAKKLAEDARNELSLFPDSVYKTALIELSQYIVNRKQ